MKNKILFITMFITIVGLSVFSVRAYEQNKKLEKRNNELSNMIHFENYDNLEVLPCPICKSEVKISTINHKYYIRCSSCGYETIAFEDIQKAIDMWNSFER